MKLNLNGWKKVNSEKDHSILQNKDGHQLKVLHKALSKDTRKQLDKLEFAEGGGVDPNVNPTSKPSPSKPKDDVPEADPKKAKEVQQGATESGWRPAEWKKNLKVGLGLAQGGKVQMFANGEDVLPAESDTDTSDPTPAYASQDPQTQAAMPGADKIASTWTDPAPAAGNAFPNPDQVASSQTAPTDTAPAGMAPMDPNAPDPAAVSDDAFNMQKSAIQGMGKNEAQALKTEAELHEKAAQDLQVFQAKKQEEDQKVFSEALAQGHDISEEKVDPEKYWENHSKVAAAIGLALSSFGGTGEAAMNFLNNQINRSVDAQKSNIANKKSLLAANMKIYGDKSAAEDATRAAGAAAIAHQIQAAAAKSGSQDAQLKAQLAVGQLMEAHVPAMQRAATIKTLNSGAAENMDPAQFINQLAKPDHQKQIAEDMDAAKETRKSSTDIMQAFERAANDTTMLKTLGGIRTPGSAMAMHALISPSFKNIDNSVRKGAMDALFENITPAPGDSKAKTAEKRNTLAKWIQTKGASSLAKTNGIDFNKFEATRPLSTQELLAIKNSGGVDPGLSEPQYAMKNGVKYQKVQGGWAPIK